MATQPENPATPETPKKNTLPFPQPPAARFRESLTARGLSPYIERAGYCYVDQDQVAAMLGTNVGSDAIAIPYFDEHGQNVMDKTLLPNGTKTAVHYTRLRLLGVEGSGKYRQPRGTKPHARFTLNCNYDWVRVCGDTDVPVIITEGEFKADLANFTVNAAGEAAWFPAIAIGGITSWTGRKQNRLLAPELESFNWKGRTVYITFDYDVGVPRAKRYKTEVAAAIDRLGAMLTSIGAKVAVLHLADTQVCDRMEAEHGAGNVKLALDDFILAGGTCAELLSTAEDASAETLLSDVLTRYAMVEGDTQVMDLTNGRVMAMAEFNMLMAPHVVERGDKVVPVSKLWLTHNLRRVVRMRGFWPDEKPGLLRLDPAKIGFCDHTPEAEESDGLVVVWNDWQPPEGWDASWEPTDAAMARVEVWNRFVEGIVGADQAERFHDWVASVAKDPVNKNATCWVITSPEQGIGKSVLCEAVAQMFGRCGEIVGPGVLGSRWNDYLYRKLMISASEVEDSRTETENAIKNMLTAPVIKIERKGQNTFPAQNFSNLLISTNRPLAFRVSEDGRREIIVHPQVSARDEAWMRFVSEKVVPLFVLGLGGAGPNGGLATLMSWYRHGYQITSGYQPHHRAPMTEAKREAAQQSKSHAEQASDSLRDELLPMIDALGGRMALPAKEFATWVQVRLTDMGVPLNHGEWMTVIKYLRPALKGQIFGTRLNGKQTKVTVLGLTHSDFMAMSPAERATLIDKSVEQLQNNQ